MNEQDWLSLSAVGLCRQLAAVVQLRKLFLLGATFLRRVWSFLPVETALAVEATERFATGQDSLQELIESWVEAEYAPVQDVLGSGDSCWCVLDNDDSGADGEDPVLSGVRMAVRNPVWFSSRAAWLALDVVRRHATVGNEDEACLAERRAQFLIYRDIVGDPTEPTRPSPVRVEQVPGLAQLLTAVGRRGQLAALDMLAVADALEEADCREPTLLEHCRQPGPHVRHCWVLELLRNRRAVQVDEWLADPGWCRW
jgi:hypothetical protein